ncbi:hypothetical protein GCM10010319_32620 [Streptomyces blastmyceticus]|uniref:Uncharacterized protein n=1 Tax=Streptomyces blastmyceticus TaxID=68180 RepID=A0ABN0X1R6_9ACTN
MRGGVAAEPSGQGAETPPVQCGQQNVGLAAAFQFLCGHEPQDFAFLPLQPTLLGSRDYRGRGSGRAVDA